MSKLDHPTLRKGRREDKTLRNKIKIRHCLGFEQRLSDCRADTIPTELR